VSTRNSLLASGQPPLLCYVTERRSLPGVAASQQLTALVQKIAECVAAGVDWVQIREKDLSARELAALTRQAVQTVAKYSTQKTRARVIVNDRLDVAIAGRAGGVHLGEKSLPPAEAKRLIQSAQAKGLLADDFLLGVSRHTCDAAKAAETDGANYIFFGPVFATPSKAAFGPPQGLARLTEVCRAVSIPVLAIGGITPENSKACLQAGAAGIAAIRLFQDSHDLDGVIAALRLSSHHPSR
jgi:thiamine-phosphate pyrophosphorylase